MIERIARGRVADRRRKDTVVEVTAGDVHSDLNIAGDIVTLATRARGGADRIGGRTENDDSVQLRPPIHRNVIRSGCGTEGDRLEREIAIDIGADSVRDHAI